MLGFDKTTISTVPTLQPTGWATACCTRPRAEEEDKLLPNAV
ncbi:hypothetical protein SNOG_15702 [Parastagonospora nodorum SN15]|uniref:Uncharacterized protein n=1 Tax=Phaeosphaeria nodorum (strain SN15 / ATCC MYA-4574 / FGSC 10173) TaxID=321614 RepID=Q0TXE9_PHANO|nr:hypothetical protein SNOG_15702 [Parastagonospora nodorum SN15]EAT76797.1 hypothetical protein SNOG_15702 [Parastagonospora nodorum SN15]